VSTKSLLRYWSLSYYTIPICILTAVVGAIIFLLRKNKKQMTDIFLYYFLGYIFLSLIFCASAVVIHKPLRHVLIKADRFADYIFTLTEFLIFFIFFKRILRTYQFKKILTAISLVFLIVGITFLSRDIFLTGMPQLESTYFLFNLQAISLLAPCIFYYLEIFRFKPALDLLQEPPFWIVTGLSFFLISTFPLSLSIDYLNRISVYLSGSFFALFYIFYTLLFLMIIRGHLCRPPTK
jgi:hypothetical protein